MNIYTIAKDAFVLGDEPHPDYGYSYRALVRESDLPVQFSSKRTNYLAGTMIAAKTAEKKTAKSSGKPYMWLTGVSVVENDRGDKGDDLPTIDIDDSGSQEEVDTPPPIKASAPGAAASSDERGDAITASMTTKLAYHGFIQTESMLPQSDEQWAAVQDQATRLYEVIQAVKSGQKASVKGSGHSKAKATADRIRGVDVTAEFGDEEPFDE